VKFDKQKEIELALIAQQISGLTLKVQAELLAITSTYTELFVGDFDAYSLPEKTAICHFREQYEKTNWQSFVSDTFDILDRTNARVIPITSEQYPPQLLHISSAPPVLYIRGSIDNLHLPQIAVVGSRKMTKGGQRNAHDFSRFLANSGFVITSGLALGIDGAAHTGAMEAHSGTTIGVVATGIDKIYPKQHRYLAEKIIASGGSLVSEFRPATDPLPRHFPQRNRLISGLSVGVLVVEAAIKSGSLITARTALEQNREVFSVPGSIHSPQSKGCHWLLKQGATLVEEAEDIITQLAGSLAGLEQALSQGKMSHKVGMDFDQDERVLLDIMGFDLIDLDTLIEGSKWSVKKLTQMLICLELRGAIDSQNGHYQRRV
jgi:DNA processing protein